jgi:hypothetical protein
MGCTLVIFAVKLIAAGIVSYLAAGFAGGTKVSSTHQAMRGPKARMENTT